MSGYKVLEEGQQVVFEVGTGPKGPQAESVSSGVAPATTSETRRRPPAARSSFPRRLVWFRGGAVLALHSAAGRVPESL